MLPRLFTTISIWVACFCLVSCEDCGPNDEPFLRLNIQASAPFKVDTVYGLGAVSKSSVFVKQPSDSQFATYELPLNLNADSTQYIVSINGRQEAITVFYQRKFYYRSRGCGYVFDLYPPALPGQLQAKTTRGRVNNVTYTQNNFRGELLRAGQDTGIRMQLTL
jgi:hypothetical protein